MPMHFKIITPLRTALEAEVLGVKLPGTDGEMEVMPGHTGIITSVANGELVYRPAAGEPVSLFVGGGFLQVENDNVLLVTDTAVSAGEIDTDSVGEAVERAQKALREKASVLSREELVYLEAAIAKQMAMLEYRKHHRK
ncbi:MAG: ATP synthase F1 subunit epsilon [Akkermansia muciniphila]|nr:ATP synthase F1 subunit epsilon [Akkermansia muciniphila]